ncbi:MAG: complex I NDUFA9 subunit family protein [Ghiorsea sp.]|nr:complex I NDUFA9 subunit family protein [Ghiorsea sp.]
MGQRICIIGGTGFVGRVIARQAVEAGHQVVVTSRHPERARDMLVKGIQVLKSDITTGKGIAHAMQGCDTVINLVGLLFPVGKNTFEAAHVAGVKFVIEACKTERVSQLLHMSALLSQSAIQHTQYGQTKQQAEKLVRKSDLNWSIFHPSIIFGNHDSFLMRFKSLSALGSVLPVIAGETKFQPVWVEDVARAFVTSIANPKAQQQIYTLAGNDIYTFKTMLAMWMKALGRERTLLAVPNMAAQALATISKLLPTPVITHDQLKLLQYDNTTQGEAFPSLFGSPSSFESLLPMIASGGQAVQIQHMFNQARTHYRKS